jgi:hypothetical protein
MAFPDLASIKQRWVNCGFTDIEIYEMGEMHTKILDQKERARIEKIEFLDEIEEWLLFQKHYYMSLAKRTNGVGLPEEYRLINENLLLKK